MLKCSYPKGKNSSFSEGKMSGFETVITQTGKNVRLRTVHLLNKFNSRGTGFNTSNFVVMFNLKTGAMKKFTFTLIGITLMSGVNAQSVSTPYNTGFDSPPEQNGWQEFRTGHLSTYNWGYSNAEFSSAPTGVSHDYPVGGNANDTVVDWFVSPPFTINGGVYISFETRIYSISGSTTPTDYFGLWYSIGEPDPVKGTYQPLMNLTPYTSSSGNWMNKDTVLNGVNNDSVYFAFKYQATQNWFVVQMDDLFLMPTASIPQNEKHEAMTIYPQPADDKITWQLQEKPDRVAISLFDISGRKMAAFTNLSGTTISLDVSTIPSGLYVYQLMNAEKEISTGRISIQH